jgi:hypothetical protein
VDGEQCVLRDGTLGEAPHLPLLPRADVRQSEARVGAVLQTAYISRYRAQEDVEAVPGWVGDRVRQAQFAELAREHPVLGDGVWVNAAVVQAEASATCGKSRIEAMRCRAAEELPSAWNVPRIDQHGFQWGAGRVNVAVEGRAPQ